MSEGEPTREEFEAVLRQRDALNEQIKLFVATEQRLYRFQNVLDDQLGRVRALADYSLRCSITDSPTEILDRALALLCDSFDASSSLSVEIDPTSPHTWTLRGLGCAEQRELIVEVDEATSSWAEGRARASIMTAADLEAHAPLRSIVAALDLRGPARRQVEPRAELIPCLALRPIEGQLQALILARPKVVRGRPSWLGQNQEGASPFLELLALHVENAVRNASLSADVRNQALQLAKSNLQLTRSLETLENAQRQLVEAQKLEAIGRLAGGVAHDFNNILTIVLNRADALLELTPQGSPGADHARSIAEAGRRAAAITSQLLAFGRKQRHSPDRLAVNELVQQMARMVEPLLDPSISQKLELAADLPALQADPAQLEQVLLNLVLNARDAMPGGGVLSMSTRIATREDCADLHPSPEPSGFLALSVEDTGIGMDERTRQQVFEPFFTTKETGKGTGLGLATVYGLVRQHGGHVVVRSMLGAGSSFVVLLPFTKAPSSGPPTPSTDRLPLPPTVLLVDDEEGIRSFAARALRQQGCRVLEACDGEDALESINDGRESIDLLVTDVVMPRCGGFELARKMRSRQPGLRVLYMSGYSLGQGSGADAHDLESMLYKPFTADEFLASVRKMIPGMCTPDAGAPSES